MLTSIRDDRVAPFIGVSGNPASGWPYPGNGGHWVTAYAITNNGSHFWVADPWGGFVGRTDFSWFQISVHGLHNANTRVDFGYAW